MSSTTKSKSTGKETNENSKNNPKDKMPKMTSTIESNSKGARPKTSSKPEKSKKATAPENSKNNPKDEVPEVISTIKSNSKGARPKTSSKPEKFKKVTAPENSKNNPKGEMPQVTSTTESNSKGTRPKTSSKPEKSKKVTASENSKNNPKDEMPQVTSTTENNSKGAMPKISSKLEKPKKVTASEKQLLVPVRTGLKVLTMNASGPNQGKGTATRRKQAIQNVIERHEPDLVLFQEFTWKGINGETWSEHYQLTRNNETSILININESTVEEKPIRELQIILEELQRATSKHPTPIPLEFTPIPRMALRMVKTKGVPVMEFICISWHEKHTGLSNGTKVTEFTYLMSFVEEIYVKYQLPLLIAGDFNVDMELICHKVKDSFKLYEYKASKRRVKLGVIDYFIATRDLNLSDMEPVDLKKDSKADKPEEVLDHDPIIAMLEPAPLSVTVPAPNKATFTMPHKP